MPEHYCFIENCRSGPNFHNFRIKDLSVSVVKIQDFNKRKLLGAEKVLRTCLGREFSDIRSMLVIMSIIHRCEGAHSPKVERFFYNYYTNKFAKKAKKQFYIVHV